MALRSFLEYCLCRRRGRQFRHAPRHTTPTFHAQQAINFALKNRKPNILTSRSRRLWLVSFASVHNKSVVCLCLSCALIHLFCPFLFSVGWSIGSALDDRYRRDHHHWRTHSKHAKREKRRRLPLLGRDGLTLVCISARSFRFRARTLVVGGSNGTVRV